LPKLLNENGFHKVQMNVLQQANTDDVRLLVPLTMESITDAVLTEELATREEIEQVIAELYEFTRNPGSVVSGPRVIEVWGSIDA